MSEITFTSEVEFRDEGKDRTTKGKIKWCFEMEMREWGVKDFVVSVPEQEVELDWIEEDDEGEEKTSEELLSIENCGVDTDAVNFNRILTPTALEFDEEFNMVLVF